MKCNVKLFSNGSDGLKAQMNQATECFVFVFDGLAIKNPKN